MVVVLIRHPGKGPARHRCFPDPAQSPETVLGDFFPAETPAGKVPAMRDQAGKAPRRALIGNGLQVAQPFLNPRHRAQPTLPVEVESIDLSVHAPGGNHIEEGAGPHRGDLRLRVPCRDMGEAGEEHPGNLFHGGLGVRFAPVTPLAGEGHFVDEQTGNKSLRFFRAGQFDRSGQERPEDQADEEASPARPLSPHKARA